MYFTVVLMHGSVIMFFKKKLKKNVRDNMW